jgi:coenzyme Q-binding protein COQ10
MSSHHERKQVPYTPKQMFDLVADVTQYPKFIPWCTALRVISKEDQGCQCFLCADMVVGYKVFREQFRSEVTLDSEALTIEARYVDGPLKNLLNQWVFEEDGKGGCVIDFKIEFEFKNLIMQAAAKQVFDRAFSRMTDAFIARAEDIYGAKR